MLRTLVSRNEGRRLVVLHFNDVYDVSGDRAAKFVTVVKAYQEGNGNPLILFSGDCFSPSLMSVISKGAQMPPVLNAIGVRAAVFGNHEFDWGLPRCAELTSKCAFPWLMSNCWVKATGETLGSGPRTVLFEHNGIKVGLMGLIEREWLACLSTIDEDELDYADFVDAGRELYTELKEKGAEVIFALTHMRKENDERLLAELPELDLILGGHDHDFEHIYAKGAPQPKLLKSGTDFRELSEVVLQLDSDDSSSSSSSKDGSSSSSSTPLPARIVSARRVEVAKDTVADEATKGIVREFDELMSRKMDALIGSTAVDLDARFATIRSSESNASNFVADVLREGTGADLCLVNAGTLRADRVFPTGSLTMRDLFTLLPMADESAVLRVSGQAVIAALENGVSSYPRLDGRWPCVSGVRFEFDPNLKPGSRIVPGSVLVESKGKKGKGKESKGGSKEEGEKEREVEEGEEEGEWQPIALDGSYTVATKAYLASGKDGYHAFRGAEVLLDGEQAPLLPGLVRNHFVQRAASAGLREAGPFSPMKLAKQTSLRKTAPGGGAAGGGGAPPPSTAKKEKEAGGGGGDDSENHGDRQNVRPPRAPATPAAAATPAALGKKQQPVYETPRAAAAPGSAARAAATPVVANPFASAICPMVEGRIVRVAELAAEVQ